MLNKVNSNVKVPKCLQNIDELPLKCQTKPAWILTTVVGHATEDQSVADKQISRTQ